MRNFKIILESAGTITQLPDSQKIFGALITMLAKTDGDEKASELVRAVLEKRVYLALSNMLPLDYVPVPQEYIVDRISERMHGGESLKERRAAVKERSYVRIEDLQKVLESPEICCSLFPYITVSGSQQLRASIDSVRYGIEGLESRLYTIPTLRIRKAGEGNMRPVSKFYFYLQGDEGEFLTALCGIMEKMMQDGVSLILGKRASQGMNKYRIAGLKSLDIPYARTNKYLNLGMLLPDKIDFMNSVLRLHTSERRPFSMAGGWNQTFPKRFISFIDSGSIIALTASIQSAGRCIPSPFRQERDIVFGNAFLYPIELREGKK